MRFKLDENLGRRAAEFLRSAGHDAVTVRDEKLGGLFSLLLKYKKKWKRSIASSLMIGMRFGVRSQSAWSPTPRP